MKKSAVLWWASLSAATLFFCYPVGYFVLDSKPRNLDFPFSVTGGEGVGAYIINLDRSKERYASIKPHVDQLELPTERIEAVDGAALSQQEVNEKLDLDTYRVFLGHTPKRGTIGCSLSHIKVWQTFLKSTFKFAVIFEDDVSFEPNKLKVVMEDLLKNSDLWDVVNFETHGNRRMPISIKTLVNNHQLCLFLGKATHTGCYMINRKAAKHLLEKALPIKMHVDQYFNRSWELDIKFTGVENPRLVFQTFGDSDIGKTNRVSEDKVSALDVLNRLMWVSQTSIIRFAYNLKLYFFGSR